MDSDQGASWGGTHRHFAVAARDGIPPACGAAGADAWADGVALGHGVESQKWEGHALSPDIIESKEKKEHDQNCNFFVSCNAKWWSHFTEEIVPPYFNIQSVTLLVSSSAYIIVHQLSITRWSSCLCLLTKCRHSRHEYFFSSKLWQQWERSSSLLMCASDCHTWCQLFQ